MQAHGGRDPIRVGGRQIQCRLRPGGIGSGTDHLVGRPDRGEDYRAAVIHAARTRLRPVLMTSMCTAFGSVPLLLASGAGELSRQSIGAVVFFGVTFSVLLTLVVVPTVYMLLAKNTHSPEYVSQLIDKLASSPRNRQATES